MKLLASALAFTVVLAACGDTTTPPADSPGGSVPATDASQPELDTPPMMAASLRRLVTKDHTFGDQPPPFTEYLVLSSTDPSAGDGSFSASTPRPLTDDERSAIEAALSDLGAVTWIETADEWRTEDLIPIVGGSAIIGVGQPFFDSEGALVPVSLWCGGTCGTWLTYRLVRIDSTWTVTGIEGPIMVS